MNRSYLRFPNFLNKALTLSYDDGVIQDERFVEILSKGGLKCTFNLNSGRMPDEIGGRGIRMSKQQVLDLFTNTVHEVAVHGVEHLSLTNVDAETAKKDIVDDRINLERMFGRIVNGMAYANGVYNDSVVEIIRSCGIKYSRTVTSTERFDLPTDWLRLPATCHHNCPRLMELSRKFVEADDKGEAMLFYLWGHSYEFDERNNWNVIEEFTEYIGNRDNIWYATNGEIYDYITAYDSLVFSMNEGLVRNPSAIDLFINYHGCEIKIPAGQTVVLSH